MKAQVTIDYEEYASLLKIRDDAMKLLQENFVILEHDYTMNHFYIKKTFKDEAIEKLLNLLKEERDMHNRYVDGIKKSTKKTLWD